MSRRAKADKRPSCSTPGKRARSIGNRRSRRAALKRLPPALPAGRPRRGPFRSVYRGLLELWFGVDATGLVPDAARVPAPPGRGPRPPRRAVARGRRRRRARRDVAPPRRLRRRPPHPRPRRPALHDAP